MAQGIPTWAWWVGGGLLGLTVLSMLSPPAIKRIRNRPGIPNEPVRGTRAVPVGASATPRLVYEVAGHDGRKWDFLGDYATAEQASNAAAYFGKEYAWYFIRAYLSTAEFTAPPPVGGGEFNVWEFDNGEWYMLALQHQGIPRPQMSRADVADHIEVRVEKHGFEKFVLRRVS